MNKCCDSHPKSAPSVCEGASQKRAPCTFAAFWFTPPEFSQLIYMVWIFQSTAQEGPLVDGRVCRSLNPEVDRRFIWTSTINLVSARASTMSSDASTPPDTLDPLGLVEPSDAMAETEPRDEFESCEIPHCEEELNAAAQLFDGDDSNPLKFIEKSVYYQDMLMQKKQYMERLEFFNTFKKTLPSSKEPTAKIRAIQANLDRINERIKVYQTTYAKKREEARKQREKRSQQAKEERESYGQLPKTLKSAISKTLQKRKLYASKAAIEAIANITSSNKDASEKEKLDAGF